MQRTRASRFAQTRIKRPRRLAPVADLYRSARTSAHMRHPATILASALLLFGCSTTTPVPNSTWRASEDNGDKPGIGIEIQQYDGRTKGRIFLLDPEHPHDFGAGSPVDMMIHRVTPTAIWFSVAWSPDHHEELIVRFPSELRGRRVVGILETVDQSGAPKEYSFLRIR